jgi:CBS domain-containing membrane protein
MLDGHLTMLDIETIMTTDLVTISPEDNLALARELMHEKKIHHLLVVEGIAKLVGLVTLTDLLASTDSRLRGKEERIHAEDIQVRDVMTTDLATVDRHASLRSAALFLEKHKIGCLPVMSNDKLCGIITDTDFVGVAINLLEQMEYEEPDEL